MKARISHSALGLAVAALLTAVGSSAGAQSKTGDRVMIPTLQSSDKELGGQAAEAIRNQLQKQTNIRELVVVPKADIVSSLTNSGYNPTEALAPGDAKALATLVRAPQYLDGVVSKTPTGFKIDSRLIISRDMNRGQVLPSAQAAKLDDAANQVAKSIKDARRQLAGEETCHNAVAQGKYQEGVAAARSAMAGYPTANIAAACLVDAYAGLKMDDSVIAISERIRSSDPRNTIALRRLAEAYHARNDTANELKVLGALAAADPTNIKMVQDVVASFGQLGHAQDAVPLVRDLVQSNPGDPELLKLAWVVYLNAKDFKDAIPTGTELVRVDTAAATADYYARLAGAYSAMGQKQQASEAAARGFAKFPGDPNLQLFNAQAMYQNGQLQMALDAAKRAVTANPKNAAGYFLLATVQDSLNQYDDLYNTLQAAKNNGVDAGTLSQLALKQGGDAYKTAQTSKDRADYQRAIKFSQLSDQFQTSVDAKFLLGANAFLLGQSATTDASERKSCDLARTAREAFNLASMNLPAAGQKYPNEAAQLMTAIPQFTPAVDSYIKRFCK